MTLREYVRHCEACGELTSHARRVVALPVLVAAGFGLLAGGAFAVGLAQRDTWNAMVALPLGIAAVALWRWDRERCLWIACGRCRGRAQADARRRRPRFDGNTERFFCF